MALIIETGAGVADANSYDTVAAFTAFMTARGLAFDDSAQYEPALMRAMDVLEALSYDGKRTYDTQVLSFPRTGVCDRDGDLYATDEIPLSIISAQRWLAHYINAGNNPGDVATAAVKREKVDVLETEYAVSETVHSRALTVADLPNVYSAIRHLLAVPVSAQGTWGSGRVVRA